MATVVPTFSLVEQSAAPPKSVKVLSAEQRALKEAYLNQVKIMVSNPGKVTQVTLPDEKNAARAIGIRFGHAIKEAGMEPDKFETWNDGKVYCIQFKAVAKSNGAKPE